MNAHPEYRAPLEIYPEPIKACREVIAHKVNLFAVSYTHLDVYKRQTYNRNNAKDVDNKDMWLYNLKHRKPKMCIRDSWMWMGAFSSFLGIILWRIFSFREGGS